MQNISISRPLAIHLLSLAQKSPTIEVCGLIGAIDNKPSTVYPISNKAGKPDIAFEMDEQEQIDALRNIREKNEKLFAIYHSHPNSPAQPSDKDLNNVGYPDVYQLIMSLNTKGVLEMRAYQLSTKGLEEVKLEV